MKKAAFSLCIALLSISYADAHCLTAFKDTRPNSEKLYALDNGKIIELAYKVKSFQVGSKMIAFVTTAAEFKVYVNGKIIEVQRTVSTNFPYSVTDEFVFYGNNRVFDGHTSYEMCSSANDRQA